MVKIFGLIGIDKKLIVSLINNKVATIIVFLLGSIFIESALNILKKLFKKLVWALKYIIAKLRIKKLTADEMNTLENIYDLSCVSEEKDNKNAKRLEKLKLISLASAVIFNSFYENDEIYYDIPEHVKKLLDKKRSKENKISKKK